MVRFEADACYEPTRRERAQEPTDQAVGGMDRNSLVLEMGQLSSIGSAEVKTAEGRAMKHAPRSVSASVNCSGNQNGTEGQDHGQVPATALVRPYAVAHHRSTQTGNV